MPASAQVVVNEIMYNPASHSPRDEFVEIYNRSSTNVNLTGWKLAGGVDFAFPSNKVLAAGGYLAVVADTAAFNAQYPGLNNYVGGWVQFSVTNVNGRSFTNYTSKLSNTRDTIRVEDAAGQTIDSVTYGDDGEWAVRRRGLITSNHRGWIWYTDHDGLGNSLELVNANLPNDYGPNWSASLNFGGTPGLPNTVRKTDTAPLIVDARHLPIIPKSTDPVSINARIIDELRTGVSASLFWRIDAGAPPAFTQVAMFDDGAHGDGAAQDGIFGTLLPAMPVDTIVEYYIEARDALGKTRTWPAPVLDAPDLGTSVLGQVANALFQVDDATYSGTPPMYKLIMTAVETAELTTIFNGDTGSDATMNASFISIDGGGIEQRYLCGVRNRGHGSRNGTPHNYRIDFQASDAWKSMSALNMNARAVPSQVVGGAVAQKAGAAGNNSRFALLRFNNGAGPGGTPPNGLYAANEDIGSHWAGRAFPDDGGGNIYSVVRDIRPPNFNYRGENKTSYQNTYFKQSNVGEDDWRDIMGMLKVMGENPTNSFTVPAARQVANIDQWLAHIAVMNLFANGESGLNTGNNDDYYFYRGEKDPRFIMIYHDLDSILGQSESLASDLDIFRSTGTPASGDTEGVWRAMILFLHNPDFEPLYYRKLQDLLDGPFSAPQFNAQVEAVLANFPQLAGTAASMKGFMDQRRAYVLGVIQGLVPPATNSAKATLTGIPRSPTWQTTASVTVGGNDIIAYQWRLNTGAWSAEIPVATPITLSGLSNGSTNVLSVVGKNSGGIFQSQATPTTSVPWVVNTALPTVRLNELLARNDGAFNHSGTFPDVIELFNEGGATVDLAGLRLTDDPANPGKYVIPAGTTLAAGSYLVLYANPPDATPGLHLGFTLGQNGGTVQLSHRVSSGGAALDSVTYGLQLANFSIGRFGSGSEWSLCRPSFGSANLLQSLGDPAGLKINEWFAASEPPTTEDFIELYNPATLPVALGGLYLSDEPLGAPAQDSVAPLTFIASGGFAAFVADGSGNAGADHLNFRLPSEQGAISLRQPDLAVIDYVTYGPQRQGVSVGRCPNGAATYGAQELRTPGGPNSCAAGPSGPTVVNILPLTTTWRYQQEANLDGVTWQAPGYNDSAWPSGQALMGRPRAGFTPPDPILTPLVTNATRTTFYFRTKFTVGSLSQFTSLQFSNFIDDGAVFYLNGQEIPSSRVRLGAGAVTYSTLATSITDTSWEGPIALAPGLLQVGENTLAVEVHQAATTSQDILFGMRIDGLIVTNAASGIVVNEVLAQNGSLRETNGRTPDWIELYNPTANPVDLAGLSLNDQPINSPPKWLFPPGSIIPAGGYFLVYADSGLAASNNNTGFGLNANGGAVYLFKKAPNTNEVLNSIEYGLQTADYSVGRVPSGSTNWVLNFPTPRGANLAATLGAASALRINEWMADPVSGDDWFEIYNPGNLPVALGNLRLTDTFGVPNSYRIPVLSYIGSSSNAFQQFFADNPATPKGPEHVNFKLGRDGDAIYLLGANNATILDAVTFGPQLTGVSSGRLPDGGTNIVLFPETPTPAESNFLPLTNVVVNELLTHTDPPLEDAIELRNTTGAPIDIGGWFLSDSKDSLRKFRIEPGTLLVVAGFTVFYEAQFNSGISNIAFALSSSKGDQVYLSEATSNGTLTGFRAVAKFTAAENGVSFGRYQNSIGAVDYPPMSRRTFGVDAPASLEQFRTGTGLANAYPRVGPIVISELMYHPPDLVSPGVTNDNVVEEFVELYNAGTARVSLFDPLAPTNTWRLRDAVDFDFPENTTIGAGGYLLVVSFDPATNAAARAQFQARYGSNSILYGPYSGKLDNSTDRVELYKPDPPNTNGSVPYILVERIQYSDRGAWPVSADGAGFSLQRVSLSGYANEPTNWVAAAPSPGPGGSSGPTDTDGDGMPDAWETQYGFNPNNPADAALDFDGDGMTNLQEYLAGTDPKVAGSLLRLTPTRSGGVVLLSFPVVAGRSYSVHYQDTLVPGAPWNILTNLPNAAGGGTATVQDGSAAGGQQRFYRLVTPAQ